MQVFQRKSVLSDKWDIYDFPYSLYRNASIIKQSNGTNIKCESLDYLHKNASFTVYFIKK